MAKVAPQERELLARLEVDYLVAEYIHLRDQEKSLAPRKKALRDELMTVIENTGEYDANGNQFIELDEGMEARILQRQRRSSRSVDEDAAHAILKSKGLEDRAFVLVPVLDESEVWKLFHDGELTDEDLELIFPVKETFALVVE